MTDPIVDSPVVEALIERCHTLGADPKVTNYGGGNSSAKGQMPDPILRTPIDVMWVKGSGGDLGSLKPEGLAVLRLDRALDLDQAYQGPESEDAMVPLWLECSYGHGGAAPSIDTAMHAFVERAHVDHLHPDSIIAIATAVDGPQLTEQIFDGRLLWVPWRRPGYQLGLDIAQIAKDHPDAWGVILGGHGLTVWADTSEECERRALAAIDQAQEYIDANGSSEPFGAVETPALPMDARHKRAAELMPLLRKVAGTDARVIGHYCDDDVVLDFVSRDKLAHLAALGTSCPDHFLRTKVKPLVVDAAVDAPLDDVRERLTQLHEEYRAYYTAYYERNKEPDSPPLRGADPAVILVPGVGMFTFAKDKQNARIASEFYINAINVMRGAEALSTYEPVPEREKFRIEYWLLEEAKLKRLPPPRALSGKIALVTGAGSGIGKAIAERLATDGACVVIADKNTDAARDVAAAIGSTDVAVAVEIDVTSVDSIHSAVDQTLLAFGGIDIVINNAGLSISSSLVETEIEHWDLQHNVMARGSFLVSRATAPILMEQGMGGDIVYIVSKNAMFAGPNNVAYGAAKADQAHQVRLLAAELGPYGIRVNGINPDGVVQGSGIFASGWGANRAAIYGVPEEELGAFYAKRTLLGQEVLPEDIALAVSTLVGPSLRKTTGLLIPVDSGVAAAFLR
jgi:rhamnulose-1-phosphate aldolase/alcohol dehydrogenase